MTKINNQNRKFQSPKYPKEQTDKGLLDALSEALDADNDTEFINDFRKKFKKEIKDYRENKLGLPIMQARRFFFQENQCYYEDFINN